jgi:hypothetical protein
MQADENCGGRTLEGKKEKRTRRVTKENQQILLKGCRKIGVWYSFFVAMKS